MSTSTMQTFVDEFLGRLEEVKEISHGKYMSRCPSHPDKKASLGITEKQDRLLVHCWAGCRTSDILAAIGLDYQSLFLDGKRSSHTRTSKIRQPESLPFHRWDWRKTCAELERTIQVVRERSERIIAATVDMSIASLSDADLDEIWMHLGPAYVWLEKCEELDELLFFVQQRLREEEQIHERTFRRKRREAS